MAICSVEGCEKEAVIVVEVNGMRIPVCNECAKSFENEAPDSDEKLNSLYNRLGEIESKIGQIIDCSKDKENEASSTPGFVKYGGK